MEKLVEEIKNGNKDLYEQIVSLMKNQLYKTALTKLDSEDLAEDAVQETFLQAYNKLDQLKEPKYFKTWITKILINKCNDINEAIEHEKITINRLKDRMKEDEEAVDLTEKIDFGKEDLIGDLSDKEKDVLKLYYEQGYTTSEISKNLDMNENTVKSFLCRARKKLRIARDSYSKLSKFLIFILVFTIVTSGITFAGRWINNLKEKLVMLQITSTKGIDDAKDYIENINTQLVYNNDIGIKIDNVAMDDNLLYLSYVFDVKDEIKGISLEEYIIRDEAGNLLSVSIENDIDSIFTSDYSSGGVTYSTNPIKQENGMWSYSTTFQVVYNKNYPLSHKIYVDIDEISVLVGRDRKTIKGPWKFEIDLPEKFYNRTSQIYKYESNNKIKNVNASLKDLSFELEIEFNENVSSDVLTSNNLILENANGELINCYSKLIGKNKIRYICDISKYSEATDELSFYIKYNKGADKYVDVILEK